MAQVHHVFEERTFRSLVSVVVPGMAAAVPWATLALRAEPKLQELVVAFRVEAVILSFLGVVTIGMILSEVGSWIESRFDKRAGSEFEANWCAYLRADMTKLPSARHYIHDLVTALKFELNMSVGLSVGVIGCIAVWWYEALPVWSLLAVATFLVLLVAFLYRESRSTHEVLGKVRSTLISVAPSPTTSSESPPAAIQAQIEVSGK